MPKTASATSAKPRRSSARATSRPLISSASTRSPASTSAERSRSGQVARVETRRREADLLVGDRRESELVEDGLHRARGTVANRDRLGLAERLDAGVDLPVALHRQPLVQVVRVVVAAAEHVVVARHRRVTGRDEVGPGEELPHQLRGLADLGVARDRVVAGGDLEVEPGSEHVLGQHLTRAAWHGQRQGDARDGAVLNALRACGAHERKAARLQVEHRLALGLAHQRLRAAARGEPNLDSARRIGRCQERLRPRRVVSVDEDRLRAVHRQRLRIRHEAEDRKPEVEALLDRALRQDPERPVWPPIRIAIAFSGA